MAIHFKGGEVQLNGNGTGTISIDISAGRRFQIGKISIASTGTFKITDIEDSAKSIHYNSGSIYSAHFDENGGKVLNLLDLVPLTLEGSTKLVLTLTDLSTSTNDVEILLIGDESG